MRVNEARCAMAFLFTGIVVLVIIGLLVIVEEQVPVGRWPS